MGTSAVKNGPEDDRLLVGTCSRHITLCNNKYSRSDVQFFSITRGWKAENLSLGFPFATDSEKHELMLCVRHYIESCNIMCNNICPGDRKAKGLGCNSRSRF